MRKPAYYAFLYRSQKNPMIKKREGIALSVTFYFLACIGLGISFAKDKQKTIKALKKAWKSFENIMPQFLTIVLLIGLTLAMVTPAQISQIMGKESGWTGTLMAAVIGAITLLPGFVAFPLAGSLLRNGAGYAQIAAFVSTLMTVGIITFPLESQTIGRKAALLRNVLAFIFSLGFAVLAGSVL